MPRRRKPKKRGLSTWELIHKTCGACGKENAPHRVRGDDHARARSSCVDCQAGGAKAWRDSQWQRRKAYDTWKGMIRRCHGGGRGCMTYGRYGGARPPIQVTSRWRGPSGFANFLADLGYPPERDSTLHRKNGAKNYTKGNTRWATKAEQNRERSTSILLTLPDPTPDPITGQPVPHKTLTLCVKEWSRLSGVPESTIRKRLKTGGWSDWEAVFTLPCGRDRREQPTDVPF